jgi:hypothetical protein
MSISYKKVNRLIDGVLDSEPLAAEFDSLSDSQLIALSRLCKEIYMLESSPGNEYSSSQVSADIKGKISLAADKIIGGTE